MEIVIVENDASLLRTLKILLEGRGDRVKAFDRPVETCSFLEQGGSYDVMIVDYMMPELTAGELLERTRGYLSRDGFIILISGHTDVVEQLNLKSMGVDIFLPKPLDLELLWEAVGSGGKAESRSMPT